MLVVAVVCLGVAAAPARASLPPHSHRGVPPVPVTDADGVEWEVFAPGAAESMDARPDPTIARHRLAWKIAGVFAVVATLVSFAQIRLHLVYNTQDHLRKFVLRILLMVPIYAVESWLGLRFKATAEYFDTMRDCYESLVIYSFYVFLVEYIGGERQLVRILRGKPHQPHVFPFTCFRDWQMGVEFAHKTQLGILQFVVLKPLMAVLSFAFDSLGLYWEGTFSWTVAYPYILIVDNISQTVALYSLVIFYMVLREELEPINPVPKFFVVKAVVFFSYWQGCALTLLVHFGVLRQTESYSTEDLVNGLQDFLVCVEMLAAAIAHHYAFPAMEFHDPSMARHDVPAIRSLFQAVDVTDVFLDDVDNALFAAHHHRELESAESSPLLAAGAPPGSFVVGAGAAPVVVGAAAAGGKTRRSIVREGGGGGGGRGGARGAEEGAEDAGEGQSLLGGDSASGSEAGAGAGGTSAAGGGGGSSSSSILSVASLPMSVYEQTRVTEVRFADAAATTGRRPAYSLRVRPIADEASGRGGDGGGDDDEGGGGGGGKRSV